MICSWQQVPVFIIKCEIYNILCTGNVVDPCIELREMTFRCKFTVKFIVLAEYVFSLILVIASCFLHKTTSWSNVWSPLFTSSSVSVPATSQQGDFAHQIPQTCDGTWVRHQSGCVILLTKTRSWRLRLQCSWWCPSPVKWRVDITSIYLWKPLYWYLTAASRMLYNSISPFNACLRQYDRRFVDFQVYFFCCTLWYSSSNNCR